MNNEREARVWPGLPMLALTIALYVLGSVMLARGARWEVWTGLGALALAVLFSLGFFTLQPNEARVLILFGRYHGTTRQVGSCGATRSSATAPPVGGRARSAGATRARPRRPGACPATRSPCAPGP